MYMWVCMHIYICMYEYWGRLKVGGVRLRQFLVCVYVFPRVREEKSCGVYIRALSPCILSLSVTLTALSLSHPPPFPSACACTIARSLALSLHTLSLFLAFCPLPPQLSPTGARSIEGRIQITFWRAGKHNSLQYV